MAEGLGSRESLVSWRLGARQSERHLQQALALSKRFERDVFIGTSSIFFAAVNWLKVPAYMALGQFTRENLLTSLALFPLALLSTWLGVLLVRKVSKERFYTFCYTLLMLLGLKLIWDGGHGLLA